MNSSYIVCECGQPKGKHRRPWTMYPGAGGVQLYGCEDTSCQVFSAARSRWNEPAYKSGRYAGNWQAQRELAL